MPTDGVSGVPLHAALTSQHCPGYRHTSRIGPHAAPFEICEQTLTRRRVLRRSLVQSEHRLIPDWASWARCRTGARFVLIGASQPSATTLPPMTSRVPRVFPSASSERSATPCRLRQGASTRKNARSAHARLEALVRRPCSRRRSARVPSSRSGGFRQGWRLRVAANAPSHWRAGLPVALGPGAGILVKEYHDCHEVCDLGPSENDERGRSGREASPCNAKPLYLYRPRARCSAKERSCHFEEGRRGAG